MRARYLEKRQAWQTALLPVVEARMGIESGPLPDPRALAVIASSFACLDAASQLWVQNASGEDPVRLYDRMIAAIRD